MSYISSFKAGDFIIESPIFAGSQKRESRFIGVVNGPAKINHLISIYHFVAIMVLFAKITIVTIISGIKLMLTTSNVSKKESTRTDIIMMKRPTISSRKISRALKNSKNVLLNI